MINEARKGRSGSLIVAALLLFTLLLALGLGLMSSQAGRMRAAQSQADAVQAKELALAGWSDVRTKLGKDLFFPPITGEQGHYSYSEDVYYILNGTRTFYGTYTVMIDISRSHSRRAAGANLALDSATEIPLGFYLITCIGKTGGRGEPPRAERVLVFEVDPQTFRVIRTHDLQAL